jgi:hypothetical protein
MGGDIVGLDFAAALAAADAIGPGVDSAALLTLLQSIETGALIALEARRKFRER